MNCSPDALARYATNNEVLLEFVEHISNCRVCRDALMEIRRWQHRDQYRRSPELVRPVGLAGRVLDRMDEMRAKSAELPKKEGSKQQPRQAPKPTNEEETMQTTAKETIPIEKSADACLKERLEALLEDKIRAVEAAIVERTKELQEEKLKFASDLNALRNEYSLVPSTLEFLPAVIADGDGRSKRAITPPSLLDMVIKSILDELGRGPKSTSELVRELGSLYPTVFRHDTASQMMRRLEKRGLVKGRKSGPTRTATIFWSLAGMQRKTA